MKKNIAVVVAAGQGKRMGADVPKQFLTVRGRPLLCYCLDTFEKSACVQEVILVTNRENVEYCKKEIVQAYSYTKVSAVVEGGAERCDSVYRGLCACGECGYVFIHDAARPFLTQAVLERAWQEVQQYRACVVGVPAKDTIKIADGQGFIRDTPPRKDVWVIQTPQVFAWELVMGAYQKLQDFDKSDITDDAMVVERMTGEKVHLVQGDYRNVKITTPEDLVLAESFL